MIKEKKAWVVAVDMGYGHQRTAYPLKKFALGEKIINANSYSSIPQKDKLFWESTRRFYEFISNFKKTPLIGNFAFSVFDAFQRIPEFYPKKDLSKPTLNLKKIFSLIKKGWGRDLVQKLNKKPAPLITTFFIPAFMAEYFGYQGEIFCVICDADVSRTWVSLEPRNSGIKYFVPNVWVKNRLKLYGVKDKNIFLTGYPLPVENIGSERNFEIAKKDLACRILNLDPEGKYRKSYNSLIEKYVGVLARQSNHQLTILFSIGGAGAQKEIVNDYLRSLAQQIKNNKIKIIISAGVKSRIADYFFRVIVKLGLEKSLYKNIEILSGEKIDDFFGKFNSKLSETDILWTKPSELSFYSGLGLPILIAPPVGSQEEFNKKWLLKTGAGILEEEPRYANHWLLDYVKSGRFAQAAMQGFIEVEKAGVFNIERICFKK